MGSTTCIPRVKLGSQGMEVSRMGYGCAGLSGYYQSPVEEEHGISMIKHAYNMGITLFDTGDFYGAKHANEFLLAKALKDLPREKVQVATKFGFKIEPGVGVVVDGRPEYVRACCEGSLKRLGLDYIDLYYQHRVDKNVPIEETVGEMKKLVEEGKVKYLGLSEAGPDIIRRAHAVHPITAIQMEWSLWSRGIEKEIVPLCRELGISIVTYGPLGRGFFAGKATVENLPENSALNRHARFSGENLEKNKILYQLMQKMAAKHNCTTAQLALAWLINQGDHVVPIPGTTKLQNLVSNIGALDVKLTKEDMKEISETVSAKDVAGSRIIGEYAKFLWDYEEIKAENAGTGVAV